MFGLSFIVGPFIGGWITDNISWHWVFYVNVPVGLAAFAVIAMTLPNFHPPIKASARDLDYLGIAVFTAAIVPILIGLTNKVTSSGVVQSWTAPSVGGLILLGLILTAVFLFIESRASQPIIPLHLFRIRTYSAANIAVFMVSFGMFASIIFLPRYYQAVRLFSATDSGYQIWPLLAGLIGSSIASGFAITRTGKYKFMIISSMLVFIAGAYLLTRLTATTSNETLWFWMLLIGLGIGPSMSAFTTVVQNIVPVAEMGVATSTLTFLRQIGGSVGLAIAGTLFSEEFASQLPKSMAAQRIPPAVLAKLGHSIKGGSGNFTGVGLAAQLQNHVPTALIARIVAGIDNAFALAVGQVFWLTFWSAILAVIAALFVKEVPLRGSATISGEAASNITGSDVECMEDMQGQEAAV